MPVTGVVSQARLDLAVAAATGLGGGAVADLLGGSPAEVPDRYRMGSPIDVLPAGVKVRCVHSPVDGIVPLAQSESFVVAAAKAGIDATLTTVAGDHFALITPGSAAWQSCLDSVAALTG